MKRKLAMFLKIQDGGGLRALCSDCLNFEQWINPGQAAEAYPEVDCVCDRCNELYYLWK